MLSDRRRSALALIAVLALAAPSPLTARSGRAVGLTPGTWAVSWIEPRLSPASEAHVTEFMRCYSAEDAARGANPALPRPQDAKCKTELSNIGGDIVYDTACADADHQLRMFACGKGFCGTYRYVTKRVPRGTGIYESVVIIRPSRERCVAS